MLLSIIVALMIMNERFFLKKSLFWFLFLFTFLNQLDRFYKESIFVGELLQIRIDRRKTYVIFNLR